MLESTAKVDFKIDTGDKVSVYPVRAIFNLHIPEDHEINKLQKEKEEEHRGLLDAGKRRNEINKELSRIGEDLADLNDELEAEEDKEQRKKLLSEKKPLKNSLRRLQDEKAEINEKYPYAEFLKASQAIEELAAKSLFLATVEPSKERDALCEALEKYNFKYSTAFVELGRLIKAAQKKK